MAHDFQNIPDWFSQENQGAGVAVADITSNGTADLIVFMIDNPLGRTAVYRIGRDLDANGNPTADWSTWFGMQESNITTFAK